MKSFLVSLLFLVSFSISAQAVDDFQKEIIYYLNSNGTKLQYAVAYDEMFVVLKSNFERANVEVPEEQWNKLKNDKDKSLEEVITFLTFAYRKHFTREEIKEMTEFYNTPEAQKLIQDASSLTKEENKKVTAFFNSKIGKKIESKRAELSEDISEISTHWSRDLFAAKMSALVKAGYSPQ